MAHIFNEQGNATFERVRVISAEGVNSGGTGLAVQPDELRLCQSCKFYDRATSKEPCATCLPHATTAPGWVKRT